MNMILHGIEAPKHHSHKTLSRKTSLTFRKKDRYEVVLANPPFGGSERKEVQK